MSSELPPNTQDEELKFWVEEAKKWAGMYANKRIEAETAQYTGLRWQRRAHFWVAAWCGTTFVLTLGILWAVS